MTSEVESFQKLASLILPASTRIDSLAAPISRSVQKKPTLSPLTTQHDLQKSLGSSSPNLDDDMPNFAFDNYHQTRKVLSPKASDKKSTEKKPAPLDWLAGIGRRKRRTDEISGDNGKSNFQVHSVVKQNGVQIQQLIETCESACPRVEVQEMYPVFDMTETYLTAEPEVTETFSAHEMMDEMAAEGPSIELVGTYPRVKLAYFCFVARCSLTLACDEIGRQSKCSMISFFIDPNVQEIVLSDRLRDFTRACVSRYAVI